MHRARQLLGRHRRIPRCVLAAPGAELGDDDEIVGIGMERFANELIGDVRAVIVARVDVIDAARRRLAQHRDRAVAVLRRPEHPRSGELHRAVAEALHDAIAKRERCGFADVDHGLFSWFEGPDRQRCARDNEVQSAQAVRMGEQWRRTLGDLAAIVAAALRRLSLGGAGKRIGFVKRPEIFYMPKGRISEPHPRCKV